MHTERLRKERLRKERSRYGDGITRRLARRRLTPTRNCLANAGAEAFADRLEGRIFAYAKLRNE